MQVRGDQCGGILNDSFLRVQRVFAIAADNALRERLSEEETRSRRKEDEEDAAAAAVFPGAIAEQEPN